MASSPFAVSGSPAWTLVVALNPSVANLVPGQFAAPPKAHLLVASPQKHTCTQKNDTEHGHAPLKGMAVIEIIYHTRSMHGQYWQ